MQYIDLRSDTVTMPTQAMRDAMHKAEVGDDVFRDDPSVNELEELAAKILGKEAALFVSSGTQGNMAALMSHTRRGDAVILGPGCHIADHESGTYGMLAGLSAVFTEHDNYVMRPESVKSLIRGEYELQEARTGLVCVENAHSNGIVVPLDVMAKIYNISNENKVPVHLDGARLFNAAAYLDVDVKKMTQYCDSVMCCLSKGLCAPVGSVLAGEKEFIMRARKIRKALGGGMRQAGFLAAAGKIALTDMAKRVKEDHDNARYLAEKLKSLNGVALDLKRVEINMIFFTVDWTQEIIDKLPGKLLERGIKIYPATNRVFRFLTNNDVSREDCDKVVYEIKQLI